MRADEISLIISTYESPRALEQVLRGVSMQTEMPGEIFLADDGSGPATRELVARWQPRLPVPLTHLWQEHQGFRKTIILNQALARARGKYIVLLDGDCVPHARFISDHATLAEPNFWVQGRRCFVAEKAAASFQAKPAKLLGWILRGRIKGLLKAVRWPMPLVRRDHGQRGIIGCNLGAWRDDLAAVNGFDEDFIGWGGEDSDLGNRLYNLGRARKFVYGRALVYHLDHPALSRAGFARGMERVAETIRARKIRCARGLDQYA